MENVVLKIKGMVSPRCTASIKRVLEHFPGVITVDISLVTAQAKIVFDPLKTAVSELMTVIEDAGFDVVPV